MDLRNSFDSSTCLDKMSIDVRLTNVYAEKALDPWREEMKCIRRRIISDLDAVTAASVPPNARSINVLRMTADNTTTVANIAVFKTCQSAGKVTFRVSGVRKASSSEGSISDNLLCCHKAKILSAKENKCSRISTMRKELFICSME